AEALPRAVAPLAVAMLTSLAAVAVFAVLAPWTGLIVAAGLVLAAAAAAGGAALTRATRRGAGREGADRDAAVVALPGRLDETVAFGLATGRLDALRQADDAWARAAADRHRSSAWAGPAQALVAGLCTAAVTAVGVAAVRGGTLSWDLLAVVALLAPAVF